MTELRFSAAWHPELDSGSLLNAFILNGKIYQIPFFSFVGIPNRVRNDRATDFFCGVSHLPLHFGLNQNEAKVQELNGVYLRHGIF
ncbi:hypothetical protein [Ornithobacterium rhinotracheale]